MKRLFSLAAVAVVSLAGAVQAAGVYNVSALSNAPGSSFGYDPDKPAPTVTAQGFYAKGSDNGGSNGDYNSVRFSPASIGMTGLTLGDILSISYDSKSAAEGMQDWRFKVYTEDQNGAAAGWYGIRLEAKTTVSGTSFVHQTPGWDRITQTNDSGPNYYANSDGNLPATFVNLLNDTATQKVRFFDIIAGSKTGGWDYDTYINNITITAAGYQTATVTAAPVPLPASAVGGLVLVGLAALRRSRREVVA